MKWADISNDAGNILECIVGLYTNNLNVLTIVRGKSFRAFGANDILVTDELFEEIKNYVENGEDNEELVVHYKSNDILVISEDFNNEIRKVEKLEKDKEDLQIKLNKARGCAKCLECKDTSCKNNIFNKISQVMHSERGINYENGKSSL